MRRIFLFSDKAPPSSLELDEVLSLIGRSSYPLTPPWAKAVGDVEPAHVAILVDRVEEAGRAVVVRACPQLHA